MSKNKKKGKKRKRGVERNTSVKYLVGGSLNRRRTHHKKKGNQHSMKVPMMMPNVLAALCSLFIFMIFLSLVGVCR